MSDPRSDTTLLLGNVYQFQASQPERQAAMLELISRVIARWSDHANLIMIGGDFNASCRPRVGYVGSEVTSSADARLEDWSRQRHMRRGTLRMNRATLSWTASSGGPRQIRCAFRAWNHNSRRTHGWTTTCSRSEYRVTPWAQCRP